MHRHRLALLFLILSLASLDAARAACPPDPGGATVVEILTSQGEICVRIHETGPGYTETVANFLGYVTRGDYDGTFIHRSDPGFVIQGGGFRHTGSGYEALCPTVGACVTVDNEFPGLSALRECGPGKPSLCNRRGTLAMARSSPDDATSQWFVNLSDNPGLDAPSPDPGFVTFAEVVGGLGVVDAIAALPVVDGAAVARSPLRNAFAELPLTVELPISGCFDPGDIALVLAGSICANGQGFVVDPELDSFFYFISPPCFASPLACPGPELGRNSCRVVRNVFGGLDFAPGVANQPSIPTSCGVLEASDVSQSELASQLPSRLVRIEHAIVVPEPGAAELAFACLATLAVAGRRRGVARAAWLRGAKTRVRRRRAGAVAARLRALPCHLRP